MTLSGTYGSWSEYAKFFFALMAIANPIGVIPILINLTSSQANNDFRRTCFTASISSSIILLVTLVSGELVLRFFGISIASFRVGGGILILLMAISMLHAKTSGAKQTEEEIVDSEEKETVAVVPLATPLLAGPGAISTVILYAQRYDSLVHYFILAGAVCLLGMITWGLFRMAPVVSDKLGRTGINIVTRLMGLIMAAVGVEFIANGLKALFPILTWQGM